MSPTAPPFPFEGIREMPEFVMHPCRRVNLMYWVAGRPQEASQNLHDILEVLASVRVQGHLVPGQKHSLLISAYPDMRSRGTHEESDARTAA